eukprot:COSAG05_NODE_5159_length_1249_cov_1.530435_1_plen_140_part_00
MLRSGSWDEEAAIPVDLLALTEEENPTGAAGLMLRMMPIASAFFVTLFGSKVASVIRAGTVFVSSCIPLMVPVVQKIIADKKLNVETFLGIGGALYAGALGSFASVRAPLLTRLPQQHHQQQSFPQSVFVVHACEPNKS